MKEKWMAMLVLASVCGCGPGCVDYGGAVARMTADHRARVEAAKTNAPPADAEQVDEKENGL